MLELISVTPADAVDLVVWGPYPTKIRAIVGETIGVVRNADFALGIQALNIKTLGGYPGAESDVMPARIVTHVAIHAADHFAKRRDELFHGDCCVASIIQVLKPIDHAAAHGVHPQRLVFL